VAASLQCHWPRDGPRLLISSFERAALRAVQRAAPELPRGLLAGRAPADWAAAMQDLGCATLHLDHRWLSLARLSELAAEGVPVLLYTVNDAARAKQLLAAGAVAVFTDIPDTLLGPLSSGASGPPAGPGS
jgi:glycerophosphoryl diester phosphodiesterase